MSRPRECDAWEWIDYQGDCSGHHPNDWSYGLIPEHPCAEPPYVESAVVQFADEWGSLRKVNVLRCVVLRHTFLEDFLAERDFG